jgi:hypothetical protein
MRPRRLASSSEDRPLFTLQRSETDELSEVSDTTTSPTSSTTSSTSTLRSFDSFLMADTDCDCKPACVAALEPLSRRSSWDKYLYETAKQREIYETERRHNRREVLKQMKRFYGHERWSDVEAFEDVELYDRERCMMSFLGRVVLYGDASKRKCCYYDRTNHLVAKTEFRRRELDANGKPKEAKFLSKLREKIGDDIREIRDSRNQRP